MSDRISPRLLESEALRRCTLDECRGACCLHGAWIDRLEAGELLNNAALIAVHMPEDRRDPDLWFDGRREPDEHALSGEVVHTTVLPNPDHYGGTACIFLLTGARCALQAAALAAGEHPWRYKPFYCILHPFDLDDDGRITLPEGGEIRAEPASCLRPHTQSVPLVVTFAPELAYLLGEKAYQALLEQVRPPHPGK